MVSRRIFLTVSAAAGAASALLPTLSWAAEDATAEQLVTKAVAFLSTKGQAADGSYTSANGPGITGLVVAGILRNGRSPDDPAVAKSLKYLESFVQPDGGIYTKQSNHKNYETCIAVMAFSEANKDKRYDKVLKGADAFLKDLQWDEKEGKAKDDVYYGGAGYGGSKRPDLSNTTFLIDALKATGNDENSEAIKQALIFVSRCQNLETEHNTTPFAAKNPDGGFYYTPAGTAGNSQAGIDEKTGGLRSYASMTYAGLKSMIYAGVKPSDPRVKAAVTWLQKNYDLKSNPGMGQAGLFYYYNTFAKALSASGMDEFVDDKGVKHDWRKELIAELASRQREDGAWVNDEKRWMEGDANIVTAYALLALSYCKKK
ncbi:MAG: prenyltransferase/squalene oxidase repeat-containing protein [Pirellulaceae bacterium]